MKRILVGTLVVGASLGAIYWWYKKNQSNVVSSNGTTKRNDDLVEQDDKSLNNEPGVLDEIIETKDEKSAAINGRHAAAAEVMSDAFEHIMEEIKPINSFSKKDEVIIDYENQKVDEEQNSLSDELDDLLN